MTFSETIKNYSQITHIEGEGNYSWVHLKTGKPVLISYSLSRFERELAGFNFFRTHKKYLVNMDKVAFRKNVLTATNVLNIRFGDHLLPVSRRQKKDFLNLFNS